VTSNEADGTTRLLIVDDDAEIRALLQRYFELHGFAVATAADGSGMRRVLAETTIGLVLLDLGLPGEDGLELTRYLRVHWLGPIIIVTGRGDAVDRVVGLELGADDYVSKPFDLRELLARVRSVLRRTAPAPAAVIAALPARGALRFDGYTLDPDARTLTARDGSAIGLTTGEFDLLLAFAERPNRVLTRDQLMNAVRGRDAGPFDRAIDMQIGRLRRKIESDPAHPLIIKSVRGTGYLFAAKVQRD
jgi:two-component system OmpR family response regulator